MTPREEESVESALYLTRFNFRQAKIECGAHVFFSLRPDFASMACYDLMDQCKADTGALEFRIIVEPLKYFEKFAGIIHIEAGTIVFDVIGDFAVGGFRTDVDQRRRIFRRVFDRIRDEVHPYLREEGSVAVCRGKRADVYRGGVRRLWPIR